MVSEFASSQWVKFLELGIDFVTIVCLVVIHEPTACCLVAVAMPHYEIMCIASTAASSAHLVNLLKKAATGS